MANDEEKTTEATPAENSRANSNVIMAVVIAVLLAFPIGYIVGSQMADGDDDQATMTTANEESHSHADDASEAAHSHDEKHEVPAGASVPAVELMVTKDKKSGWNVKAAYTNFTITPENVNGDHVENEGHAHLWVDGKKITRLYGTDYYLGDLSEGTHEIMVTLNTNKHADYTVDGEVISAAVTVNDSHHDDEDSHSHDDGHDHSHDN